MFNRKGKASIISYLANTYPHDWPAAEIQRQTYLSKRTISLSLEELTKDGIITYRLLGDRKFYMIATKELHSALMSIENTLNEHAKPSEFAETKPTS
jgi:DNA-binding HxlR family transcriptional regulator